MTDPRPAVTDTSRGRALAAGLIVCFFFLIPAVALIASGFNEKTSYGDQLIYHLPTIQSFARQWPRPDLSNYNSATTPGYHLLLAAVLHYTSASVDGLRLASALLVCGLIFTLVWHVVRLAGFSAGLILCGPLICSNYVFTPGVWLTPHDLAWWGVLACLLVAVRPRVDRWTVAGGAIFLLATVMVRQIHLWVAAPLCMAILLGSDRQTAARGETIDDPNQLPRRWRIPAVILTILPALAALAWLAHLWHGLTPPMQKELVTGPNWAVPVEILSLISVFGIFFIGYFLHPEHNPGRMRRKFIWICVGMLVGLALGIVSPSTFSVAAGRWSALWTIVRHLPTVGGRSPLIVALATLGGAITVTAFWDLPWRSRWIYGVALLAFVLAQTTAANAWQRYHEPFILMLFAMIGADQATRKRPRRLAMAGPILLSIINVGLILLLLFGQME